MTHTSFSDYMFEYGLQIIVYSAVYVQCIQLKTSIFKMDPSRDFQHFNETSISDTTENLPVSIKLIYISQVIGWIYFVTWSISFYPQIYTNFKRKSVVGLNFDFVALNFTGFFLYALFNMGLFWSSSIESEYFIRNPRNLNPVLINDVVFSLHALAASSLIVGQCIVYRRHNQHISLTAKIILKIILILVIILAGFSIGGKTKWLDFLYFCSYIKLAITLIKYIPQAVMNYRRKCTIGWSIGNILLDFSGGLLSMLQMIINGYNFNDWKSFFGDLSKFGLGLFSVCFDILFMIQHYALYRRVGYIEIVGGVDDSQLRTVILIN